MRGDDKFLGNLVVAALNVYGDKLPVFLGFYQGFYLLLVDFLGQIPFFRLSCNSWKASQIPFAGNVPLLLSLMVKDKGTDMEQLLVQLQLGE